MLFSCIEFLYSANSKGIETNRGQNSSRNTIEEELAKKNRDLSVKRKNTGR